MNLTLKPISFQKRAGTLYGVDYKQYGQSKNTASDTKDTFETSKDYTKVQNKLLKKYKIDPKKVSVVSTEPLNLSEEEKTNFISKILEAHELAKVNVDTGNIVRVGYATNLCLSDDSWHLATNFNNTRNDISDICGERSSIIVAYNNFLKNVLKKHDKKATQSDFQIKYLAMSSARDVGTDKNASLPCADCLSWLNTSRFLQDDTKIVFLTKNKKTGNMDLEFKTLKEALPMRGMDLIDSKMDKDLYATRLRVSEDAIEVMKKKHLSGISIRAAAQNAKNQYIKNKMASFSKQNIGTSVYCGGEFFNAGKIDWSKRWFVEPAEFALSKAAEKFDKVIAPDIIAYYGDNETVCEGAIVQDGIVSLRTLGRIKAINKEANTLIVTVNANDETEVRTLDEYMPKKFTFKQSYLK